MWTTLLGNITADDYFKTWALYENSLYVGIDTLGQRYTTYSTTSTARDIIIAEINLEIGYTWAQNYIGSPGDDEVNDIVANSQVLINE